MNSASAVLQQRYAALNATRSKLDQHPAPRSIEELVVKTNNPSIELPAEIEALITGPEYWQTAKRNRYRMLIREGHLNKLLNLAQIATTKTSPANWFATAASRKAWERTTDYLSKLVTVVETVERVAHKLGVAVNGFIYKQAWKGVNVERWADLARESGKHRGKYFAWLCLREQGTAPRAV
ncbi:hypothetical protein [Streptomyces sp. NBC_00620]|uniref:hypothetical protein n=1 Tax=Streptomyces sp. NBC_00620 TaxID=2903666 RepID=UPI00225B841F|nr:hypothetical protein [Streptomyces sp. NBC_00620]MCX4976248.1 hypothetical protein [Streptomyces sp. NBC_00620]